MSNSLRPIVNACYLAPGDVMLKVRMLSYQNGEISLILLEDSFGRKQRLAPAEWEALPLIPCCMATGPQQEAAQREYSATGNNSYRLLHR